MDEQAARKPEAAACPQPVGALRTLPLRDCPFIINGRFLTQVTTGVQRYAREITGAIDDILHAGGARGSVLTPSAAVNVPDYAALDVVPVTPGGGYAWEQFVLPLRADRPILNLCNTASVFRNDQIVCIHDATVFNMPESFSLAFRSVYRMLQPLLARRVLKVTTVSHYAAAELTRFLPLTRDQITVMPDGHEHAFRWNAAASDIFTRFPMMRPFILLLGNRARHKNAQMIIDLAEEFDALGIDLVIAGGGAGIFSAMTHPDTHNVRPLGFVSDDDLAALLARALCLVFPSFTEGFGLPIVEAMALGCPVVSSNASCMPEICGDAALLAAPDDPPTWLKHVATLQASPALRSELAERGRLQIRKFSWSRSAQDYLALLD